MKRILFSTIIIIFGLIIIPILGCNSYFETDNNVYNNRIRQMKENNYLAFQLKCSIEYKTLNMEGYSIHYNVSGKENKELIVFLHPAFSDHRAFVQQVEYFSKEYKVITIDLIGHGLSKAKKSNDKIDASTEHIHKILELEGNNITNIVGVSMGALIAQYFALKYPEKVKSLTLLGGYDINIENKEVEKAQRASNIEMVFRAIFSMKSFRNRISEITCITQNGKAIFYKTTSLFERKSFLVMQGLQNVVKDRKDIKPKYPTLILTAEFDIEIAKKVAKEWHTRLNNSEFYMIKNAGHCANIDNPKEFNSLVENFINRYKK